MTAVNRNVSLVLSGFPTRMTRTPGKGVPG